MVDGLVSVIMPSWNTGKYIKESIQSVLNQTYNNLELIIVDDCSTDNTDEIVHSFNDNRIKYYKNTSNKGAALTRNTAIKKSSGEWIAFLDSDDLWRKDKLEKQINFMKKNNIPFSYHCYEKINEQSQPLNIIVSGPKVVTKKKMYNYGYPGCLTFMYNSNYFGEIQIEDIKKNNDYAILLKLSKKSSCYLLDENLALYRIRKKSISHDKFYKKLKSHYDLFHICDKKNKFMSLYYALMNMYYGLFKKIFYEKEIKSHE